jgi:hypothetical protein
MDLSQTKLTKTEWVSIEIPVHDHEKRVIQLILDGYSQPNIRRQYHTSLLQTIKMEPHASIDYFLYQQYFQSIVDAMVTAYAPPDLQHLHQTQPIISTGLKKLKSADAIRMQHTQKSASTATKAFEYILLEFLEGLLRAHHQGDIQQQCFYTYTLHMLRRFTTIEHVNTHVYDFETRVLETMVSQRGVNMSDLIRHAHPCIEKNKYLLDYEDWSLYSHQRDLFAIFRGNPGPKLVLYSAPTGTGKTLSPLGLSQEYKIIYVCMARHVGLALARAGITFGKRMAFAFGCETASDIRLHYFAAAHYQKNKRSGGIGKVDNSDGRKVEIIVCDVQSYTTAMHYMLAFHLETEIVTYWDEPTITMDYEEHPLHAFIHRNWSENRISKWVLSCATLPQEVEISSSLHHFQCQFPGARIHNVSSFDCKKSMSLRTLDGTVWMPHTKWHTPSDWILGTEHIRKNKTLLRYLDVQEIVQYLTDRGAADSDAVEAYFGHDWTEITMTSLKLYYLHVLEQMELADVENGVSLKSKQMSFDTGAFGKAAAGTSVGEVLTRRNTIQPLLSDDLSFSGILLTTHDAHTLTDGPSLYLTADVEKMGQFYIKKSNIPEKEFQSLMENIEANTKLQRRMAVLEKQLEDALGEEVEKEKKMTKEMGAKEGRALREKLDAMRLEIRRVYLKSQYVPNLKEHQELWSKRGIVVDAYHSRVDEIDVQDVMLLDCPDLYKALLLLGIGLFSGQETNKNYVEKIKAMADSQKLYLILASSDYIYGTNYPFCHCFVGKDLTMTMTPQKTIQALGRIGRNKIQQDYTVRFRNNALIERLFQPVESNLEARVMTRLFC